MELFCIHLSVLCIDDFFGYCLNVHAVCTIIPIMYYALLQQKVDAINWQQMSFLKH